MNTDFYGERIARVETRMDTVERSLRDIDNKQDKILYELTRYKGAIGLGSFLITCAIASLVLVKDYFIAHFR